MINYAAYDPSTGAITLFGRGYIPDDIPQIGRASCRERVSSPV